MSDLGSTRILGDLIVTGEIVGYSPGATEHTHPDATTSVSGFMSKEDKTKLNGLSAHPTGDGSLHVPATGTANSGKYLRAGSTAGSLSWSAINWGDVGSKPTTFAPTAHTHSISDLTGVATSSHTHTVNDVSWTASANLTCSATANGQEWSIDMPDTSYTGTYWHVWSKKGGRGTCLKVDNDTGLTSAWHGLHVAGGITLTDAGLAVPAGSNTRSLYVNASNYIAIKSHANHTWLRNEDGMWTLQCGTNGDDWTNSFQFYLMPPAAEANGVWFEIGQRRTNDATNGGKYRGVSFVKTIANGALAGGDVSIGTLYGYGSKVAMRTDDAWLRLNDQGSFSSGIYCGNSTVRTDGKFEHIKSGVTWFLNNGNSSYTHYTTSASAGHWFNKTTYVAGEIYAGNDYNQRVWHAGNLAPVKLYLTTGTVDISNTNLKEAYVTECNGNTSAPDTDWWHILYMPHSNSNGYGGQIALSLNNNSKPMYVRTALGTSWGKWRAVGTADDNNYCRTFSRVYNAVWNDYAEYFTKEDEEEVIEVGEIVMVSEATEKYIKAEGAYTTKVIGVVSNSYGHILGGVGEQEQDERENVAIGLAGRVNVKIAGNIKKGDLIVCSDIPGVGMKSETYVPGSVVGKALENKTTDDIGLIKMFIMNI